MTIIALSISRLISIPTLIIQLAHKDQYQPIPLKLASAVMSLDPISPPPVIVDGQDAMYWDFKMENIPFNFSIHNHLLLSEKTLYSLLKALEPKISNGDKHSQQELKLMPLKIEFGIRVPLFRLLPPNQE